MTGKHMHSHAGAWERACGVGGLNEIVILGLRSENRVLEYGAR